MVWPLALSVTGKMTGGDVVVGAGTLLLAASTAFLAVRTSREVKLTEQQVGLSRESIEALDRPFIIAMPNGNHAILGFVEDLPGHPGWRFAFRLWNIGKGPGIVQHVSLSDPANRREYLTPVAQDIERPVAIAPD